METDLVLLATDDLLGVQAGRADRGPLRRALRALAGASPSAAEVTGTEALRERLAAWTPRAILLQACGDPGRDGLLVGTLRRFCSAAPLLVIAPGADDVMLARLFHEGAQEVLENAGPAKLRRALRRAQARGPRPAWPMPNRYDWIFVIGVGEDGCLRFETADAPPGSPAGFLDASFLGRDPADCFPSPLAEAMGGHLARCLEDGQPVQVEETLVLGPDLHTYDVTLTPVRNKWGRIHRIAGLARDISALRGAQAALQASEERLNLALEGTQQGLWDWNLATGAVYLDPRWFRMLGYEPGEVEGRLEAWMDLVHPEDRLLVETSRQDHVRGASAAYRSEHRLRTRSGEYLWVLDAGKVVALDAEGRPYRMTGTATDITERRRAEEALRALVGGVVHEMRNPVYGIRINLDALAAMGGLRPEHEPLVRALRDSAERISCLVNDLQDYGESGILNPAACGVRRLLEDAMASCEALARLKQVRVLLQMADDRLVLPLNERRMHQVFRNLLENALHHSPEGATVRVAARRDDSGMRPVWVFTVEDEGPGFTPEVLERAFEPFFTRRKGGTGLGLSIVKRVAEEHGGTVHAGNRSPGGALLTLRLPAPTPVEA